MTVSSDIPAENEIHEVLGDQRANALALDGAVQEIAETLQDLPGE